ncbi:MAG: hypothetical protein ACI8ZQ_001629 [Bacteroidia bacterium]|jgi:hypothetical protein
MKFSTSLIIVFIASITSSCGQTVDETVKEIAAINEVQSEHIGYSGQLSDNYMNFEILKKNADTKTLLNLIDHKNSVVSCYASWALIDQDYLDLPSIFSKYLYSDKTINTFSGCIKSEDNLSSEFYHRFWNKTDNKETNKSLITIDSLIIYHNQPNWLLLLRALENRAYPKTYNERIATLAFEKGYKEAISYLSNWYKAEYKEEIRKALLKYLKKTNFTDIGTIPYYDTVADLLKFNDNEIKQIVIKKLKTDRHWEYDKEKFKFLLDEYYIYQSDLEK